MASLFFVVNVDALNQREMGDLTNLASWGFNQFLSGKSQKSEWKGAHGNCGERSAMSSQSESIALPEIGSFK